MSRKVNKINNLKKLDGFLQINYSKGFKYIDKAGEFMNNLYKGERFPKHAMDPTGMIVKFDEKTQLKVSPHHLWMHFVEPDSFDCQREDFKQKMILVNSIFEPEKYTRVGWRSYLVYDCGSSYPNIISIDFLDGADFHEIVFSKKVNGFDSRISVSKLVKEGGDTKAILFDIDIFVEEKIERDNFDKILSLLKDIEEVYKSDNLLDVINKLLG